MPPKRVTKKAKTAKPVPQDTKEPPAEPSSATYGIFSNKQILILWFGLFGGLFYGWYFQTGKTVPLTPTAQTYRFEDPNVESPWTVVEIPGKGKGVIATRDIQQGELLLREKPLFLVPPTINSSPTNFIWNKLQNLTEAQKQAFFNLSYVGLPQNKNPEKDKQHLALAIFETNAASAGSSVGIFPRMARLNHGCSSAFSAVYSWREEEGVLLIHALKPIARGSEILTTYSNTRTPRSERRSYLEQHYGFHCTCSVCALPDAESQISDARLTSMTQHYGELSKWIERKISGAEAIENVRDIWRLGDEEGYWSERGRLASDAAWVAAGHEDADAVREWALLSIKWFTYELGADSPLVKEMEAVAAAPQGHQAWSSRRKMSVGGPEGIDSQSRRHP